MGIILSNMLDNAIEALEKIPKKQRKLKITMNYETESIKIIIENPYDGKMKIDKDQIVTTKEEKNHGFGMKSIKTVAAKYGGQKMKKILIKLGELAVAFSFIVTMSVANTSCILGIGQDELPESAKKLRKF